MRYLPGVGQWDGEEWSYALPDGLGSTRQLAGADGRIVQRYDYGPFGKVVAVEGERPSALQYTGEHWDGDVGLLYLRARWYDPAIGRFLSEDPFSGFAALPQTQHAYVYVGNNPINLTDPSGLYGDDEPWWKKTLDFATGYLEQFINDVTLGSARSPSESYQESLPLLLASTAAYLLLGEHIPLNPCNPNSDAYWAGR
ncbi:MAG: RHS repeat-associated core domain-containing protein, partial [Aestuariibacter sp.]|nr:RHS repeat-associated core domain-containing protein [Aestuariibacter sp.]